LYQIYSVQRFISIMPGKEGGKAKPLKVWYDLMGYMA